MLRLRLISAGLLIPAIALLAAVGCGGGDGKSEKPTTPAPSSKKDTAKASAAKEELATKGSGVVKGKVVYDGAPPKPEPIDFDKLKPQDAPTCHKEPKEEQVYPTWRVGPDLGVANVVVWVQPPDNKYFKIPDDMKSQANVTVDQPFCAFEPHVFTVFPSYFDGKAQKATGQKLIVKNSAKITHNTNVSFSDSILNKGDNRLMPVDIAPMEFNVKPSKDNDCGKTQSVNVKCDVHPWMSAFGKIFDHPFNAVSSGGKSGDKTFGEYEIKGVPAGAEVSIMYWHESMDKPAELKKVKINEGENKLDDIKIKK